METRDQWYKPNLLYNIHYRPTKKPEPPRMIVETVQFNPSVCTCGEHGCQPQYRMEKRVLWTNKEGFKAEQQSKIKGRETKDEPRENKDERRENKFKKSILKEGSKIGGVTESKQIGLKEEIDQEHHYIECYEGKQVDLKEEIGQKCCLEVSDASKQMGLKEYNDQKSRFKEDDGDICDAAESFQEQILGNVEVRRGYKANYVVKEKESVNVQGDDDEKEKQKKDCDYKNEFGCSDRKDYVCIEENNGRRDRDNFEVRNNEDVYGEKIIGNDSGNDFSKDYKGDEKSSKEDQIAKDYTAGGDGTDGSDGARDDAEHCSERIILTNDYDEIAESCRLENEEGRWEDVEIASAFGIMTIYCNSELHNWSFIGEGALRKIH